MFGREGYSGNKFVKLVVINKSRDAQFERSLGQQRRSLLRVGRATARFFDHQAVVEQCTDCVHALGSAVPFHAATLADAIGKQIDEPFRLDRAVHPHQWQRVFRAILDVHRHQEIGLAFAREQRRTTWRRQQKLVVFPAPGDPIGKRRKDRKRQCVGGVLLLARRLYDAPDLLDMLPGAAIPFAIEQTQQVARIGSRS